MGDAQMVLVVAGVAGDRPLTYPKDDGTDSTNLGLIWSTRVISE